MVISPSLDLVRLSSAGQSGNQTGGGGPDRGEQAQYREETTQYLILVWIVSIISLSAFIRLYYLYKALLLLLTFLLYTGLVTSYMVLGSRTRLLFSVAHLLLFTLLVLYHGRQMEIASCLDFLWQVQCSTPLLCVII